METTGKCTSLYTIHSKHPLGRNQRSCWWFDHCVSEIGVVDPLRLRILLLLGPILCSGLSQWLEGERESVCDEIISWCELIRRPSTLSRLASRSSSTPSYDAGHSHAAWGFLQQQYLPQVCWPLAAVSRACIHFLNPRVLCCPAGCSGTLLQSTAVLPSSTQHAGQQPRSSSPARHLLQLHLRQPQHSSRAQRSCSS